MTNEVDDGLDDRTAKDLAEILRRSLDELGWTPPALMDRMRALGDYRYPATILRGINRALEGEIRPSGELLVLVQQAVRFQRRLLRTYNGTVWTPLGDGSHTANIDDFTITLVPESKGRWLVTMVHEHGLRPKWPRWQHSLEAAKRMAYLTLDDGHNQMREMADEKARDAAQQA